MIDMSPENVDVECDDLTEKYATNDVSGLQLNFSPRDEYQSVNEISEEVRELIASWENSSRTTEFELRPLIDQPRSMPRAAGTQEFVDSMPPPQRYRRVSKKAFMG